LFTDLNGSTKGTKDTKEFWGGRCPGGFTDNDPTELFVLPKLSVLSSFFLFRVSWCPSWMIIARTILGELRELRAVLRLCYNRGLAIFPPAKIHSHADEKNLPPLTLESLA